MNTGRLPWDEYFMRIAVLVAERSTCIRRKVGAVIVRDKHILATGYNGAPKGLPHCTEIGCLREKMGIPSGERVEICRGIHAEQNALVQAARFGISLEGGICYSTVQPCVTCTKLLINAGICRVFYIESYADKLGEEMLRQAGVELKRMKPVGRICPG
ncbi:cytidine deaminase [candidate division WOR-3 bacterium]|uniref:Cytidine deaminase n=1 Tax=candidate division WOR-3 bacterium TaxID=2052148 RepID=A0A9D5KB84_UNCW3|nr:cytidine deaminase [candidate division WOR-3 bacterium]MBD3364969.1 cytidine deaminase [candidate division WOR-3 bacterium]